MIKLKSIAILMTACVGCWWGDTKPAEFTNLSTLTQPGVKDNTSPTPIGQQPSSGSTVPFSISLAAVTWKDLMGPNGAPASGVASVTATALGRSLPITSSGDTYFAGLGGLPDGAITITWTATDFAGNKATYTMTFNLKNSGPTLLMTTTPSPTMQSNAPLATITLAGKVTDSFFQSGSLVVNRPGPSGVCDSTSTPVVQGNGPGQFQANNVDLTPSIKANGTFNVSATTFNAATTSSTPVTNLDCFRVTLLDNAVTASGAPQPNATMMTFPVALTWLPVASAPPLSVTATYKFTPSQAQLCIAVATNASRAGESFVVAVSGPGIAGQTIPGVLDATGSALVRVNITQVGTYTVTAFVGSLSATSSVLVSTTGGTCT